MRRLRLIIVFLCAVNGLSFSEAGILVVHVKDVQRHPISGLQIGVEGDGGSAFTGDDGRARIPLAKDTKEKAWVTLQILKSPPGKDFVLVSPWDYKHLVPSFENESENFVEVVVVQRGDRSAIEGGTVLSAAVARIVEANARKTVSKQAPEEEDRKASLAKVAEQYGLAPNDLDKAIRDWGAKATDLYDAGLAALYEKNYPKASSNLADSLKQREEKLVADQKAIADATFFLGRSLYQQGKYRDSSTAYQRCLELRADDSVVLNNLALSLMDAGEYEAAEPLFRRALAIDEKALGPDHPEVAIDLVNLANLLEEKGDYAGAKPLFESALSIDEKTLSADHPGLAIVLGSFGLLLIEERDYEAAETLLRRALSVDEKTLGPNHPRVATDLNNLAGLLREKGNDAAAEPLFRRALAIDEKALGSDHPQIAVRLSNLAAVLVEKRDYDGAELLYRRALTIDERALGPDHPDVAIRLNNLALLLKEKGNYKAAGPLYQRALAIDEKALGPDHPVTQRIRHNLKALKDAEQKSEK